ncbi:MAG: ribonuclease P protein component [Candidatus Azotimanducaceae bacterium]
MSALSLPKCARLLHSSEFNKVFQDTRLRVSKSAFLVLGNRNDLNRSRLGLIIGRKVASSAVKRNSIKRIIRESFRHISLESLDIIVLARPSSINFAKADLRGILDTLFIELKSKSRHL